MRTAKVTMRILAMLVLAGCGPARTWRDSTFLAHQSLPVTYKQPLLISMKTDLERIR